MDTPVVHDNQELSEQFFQDISKRESKTSRLDEILKEKLERAVHKQTSKVRLHDIAKIASEHSSIDLAYAASHLPSDVRPVLYENLLNRDEKISFLINTDSDTRLVIFRKLQDAELKTIFEKMPTDEAVWVLEDMSERRYRKVMDLIDPRKAIRIRELKKHARNSAGRLMTNEFFAFPMDMTIEKACRYIRDNPRVDFTRGIYILNHAGELQGYVPARNMIINSPGLPLRKVMRPASHKVTGDAPREEVIDIFERYKIHSLPVVDVDNYLIGVIAQEDVVEAMEDLADETIASIGGTGEKFANNEPVLRRFIARSPWLFVTLAAGLLNVGVMSSFQMYEGAVLTFVLFFVPLITGMSGNIGIQCSTVLVRSMATGAVSPGNRRSAVFKELLVGFYAGATFSVLCGLIVFALGLVGSFGVPVSSTCVGVTVSVGLIGACFAGTLLGVFAPLFFVRIGIDPAIASGPIVTAFNDFLSMTIYFLIAWGMHAMFFS